MNQILIIDDDELIREIVKAVLGYSGYQVLSASNGKEGIEHLKSTQPEIIITDINMPVMDGNEVAEYVRNSPDYKDIPMIAITGNSYDIKKGLFNNILRKPFKVEQLLFLVESLI